MDAFCSRLQLFMVYQKVPIIMISDYVFYFPEILELIYGCLSYLSKLSQLGCQE